MARASSACPTHREPLRRIPIAGLGIVALFVEVLHLGVHAFAALNVALAALWIYLAWRAGKLHDELAEKHPEREGDVKAA